MHFRANKVLTLQEAKELLGNDAIGMTDEEIQQLMDDFDIIAQYSLKMVHEMQESDNIKD